MPDDSTSTASSSRLSPDQIVEVHDVAFGWGVVELDGGAGMLVEEAGEHVRQIEAPLEPGAHRLDGVLHAAQNGAEVVFGIVQKADEQLHGAIAGAAAQAGHGGIKHVRPQNNGRDGVGEGQSQIVVRVDAHFFAGGFAVMEIFAHQVLNLFAVEHAEAIHDVNGL